MFENSLEFARKLDAKDPLKEFRKQFYIPKHSGKDCLYFCGNSLGLQPKTTEQFISNELEQWKKLGVKGHFEGEKPWADYHKFGKKTLAKLVGAKPEEVVTANSLTVNLHLMMASFYRPSKDRFKVIIEEGAFPSDQYVVETQAKFHGFNPGCAVVELKPREGGYNLRTEEIIKTIAEEADELALVLLPGVQYYTGQLFDIQAITQAGHKAGAFVGFDLAHAVGNVPLHLHDWNLDFGVWCGYKYLNAGPGAGGGLFINERFAADNDVTRFAGWWGHVEKERFLMKKGFIPEYGADGWQLSNVNIFPSASLLASLELFEEAGIENLRAKSKLLTGFLEYLISENSAVEIITPSEAEQRGCQLSLLTKKDGEKLFNKLDESGVVADWREPNVIRVAPVPLYNTFEDVYRFTKMLNEYDVQTRS